jgi:hypothetical protein
MPKRNSLPPHKDDRSTGGKSGLQYAGLATQLMVSLGLGVFIGLKADHWLRWKFPIATCVLPLLILVGALVKLVHDTSGKGGKRG